MTTQQSRRRAESLKAMVRSPGGLVGIVGLLVLLFLAVFGPAVWGDRASELTADRRAGSSAEHLFGTDRLGRDVFFRALVATRTSLLVATGAALVGLVGGALLGAGINVLGPRARRVGTRLIDTLVALPTIILALVVTTILGPGGRSAAIGIGIALCPSFARLVSNLSASVAGREYITAARVVGIGNGRILRRHVLPNIADTLIVVVSVAVATSVIAASSLSFLGLGVQAPGFDWGVMLTEGLESLYVNPAAAAAPAAAIALTGLVLGFLGEAVAQATNPLLRGRPARRGEDAATAASPVQPPAAAPATATAAATATASGAWERPAARPLVQVDHLRVALRGGPTLVADVNLELAEGERVGLVGESGSGKTLTALAIAQLLPPSMQPEVDRLQLKDQDLMAASRRRDRLLAAEVGMVFQDPLSALNPALRIERQLTEGVRAVSGIGRADARRMALDALARVRISAPERRLRQHPHELSGGMRQRVMIAMALMNRPSLLIADEPTTALDVTVQAEIIELLREINARDRTTILLISHDIDVVSELCDRVLVMYSGRLVEDAPVARLASGAAHPYTRALLAASPSRRRHRGERLAAIPGRPPDLVGVLPGCPFRARCDYAVDRCGVEMPALDPVGHDHLSACWRGDVSLSEQLERA